MPKTWACPFWRYEDKSGAIHCEGADIAFKSAEARQSYVDQRCADVPGWESCPIAQYLCEEYEQEEQK